ncbi:MAG: phage major capsid protein [Clostridiales bacterium]|nr:phage major capsid protein [Clostridiales bacterium]
MIDYRNDREAPRWDELRKQWVHELCERTNRNAKMPRKSGQTEEGCKPSTAPAATNSPQMEPETAPATTTKKEGFLTMRNYDLPGTESVSYKDAFVKYVQTGFTDKAMGDSHDGLYRLPGNADRTFRAELAARSVMRRLCRVVELHRNAADTIRVSDSDTPAQWLAEGQAMSIAGHLHEYTVKDVTPRKLAVLARMDNEVLNDEVDPLPALARELAVMFAEAEDAALCCGAGGVEPVGVVDQAESMEADALTWDALVQLYTSVLPRYRQNGVWLMSDNALMVCRTLTDANGHPILSGVHADEMLGHKIETCAGMDDAHVCFGDWGYLWLCQRQPLTVQAMREMFASRGQMGFRAMERLDGVLVRPEAIHVLTVSTTTEE